MARLTATCISVLVVLACAAVATAAPCIECKVSKPSQLARPVPACRAAGFKYTCLTHKLGLPASSSVVSSVLAFGPYLSTQREDIGTDNACDCAAAATSASLVQDCQGMPSCFQVCQQTCPKAPPPGPTVNGQLCESYGSLASGAEAQKACDLTLVSASSQTQPHIVAACTQAASKHHGRFGCLLQCCQKQSPCLPHGPSKSTASLLSISRLA